MPRGARRQPRRLPGLCAAPRLCIDRRPVAWSSSPSPFAHGHLLRCAFVPRRVRALGLFRCINSFFLRILFPVPWRGWRCGRFQICPWRAAVQRFSLAHAREWAKAKMPFKEGTVEKGHKAAAIKRDVGSTLFFSFPLPCGAFFLEILLFCFIGAVEIVLEGTCRHARGGENSVVGCRPRQGGPHWSSCFFSLVPTRTKKIAVGQKQKKGCRLLAC